MSDWQPLVLSFQIAFFATLLATVSGVLIGLWLTSRRVIGRDLIDAITTAPMVMPPTVLGYYVLVALGRNSAVGRGWEALFGSSIVFTRTGAVIAATLGSLPLVVKSARAALLRSSSRGGAHLPRSPRSPGTVFRCWSSRPFSEWVRQARFPLRRGLSRAGCGLSTAVSRRA